MIFVFKTPVNTKTQARELKESIDNLLPNAMWNFDLEDSDKILRINSEKIIALEIKELLTIHKFNCEELE